MLASIASHLVRAGKGILAADESVATMTKRLNSICVPSSYESRTEFREIIFSAKGLGEYISGVILFDETIRNAKLMEILIKQGIMLGIKVDKGVRDLTHKDHITLGLDDLPDRLHEYSKMGAKFTKWRGVFKIDSSDATIEANAAALAMYAIESQHAGLVPIVEPEVLMDGKHTIGESHAMTTYVLGRVFDYLRSYDVELDGMVLKPNMVLAGSSCPDESYPNDVAYWTLKCLCSVVPAAVPGIAFLSGGQHDRIATDNLRSINKARISGKMKVLPSPWQMTFSFGRGLQQAALSKWAGKKENAEAAQAAVLHHAMMNSLATKGE